MLPGGTRLPQAIFALNGQAVNRLFDVLCQVADRWLKFVVLQARCKVWAEGTLPLAKIRLARCAEHLF